MLKPLTTIILGSSLILTAVLTYKTYFSFFLGVYGFIAILDTVFFLREYYNKTVYLIMVNSFLICTLILYLSPLFPNNIIIHNNYIVSGVSTLAINTLVIGTLLLILIMVGSVYKMEKYRKALDSYNRTIKKDPENIKILYRKGLALIKLEEYKNAVKVFNRILNIDPENIQTLHKKGLALTELERYDEAMDVFNKILKSHPENFNALYSKGFILRILNRDEEALLCYDKALKLEEKISKCCLLDNNPFKILKESEKEDTRNFQCNRKKPNQILLSNEKK